MIDDLVDGAQLGLVHAQLVQHQRPDASVRPRSVSATACGWSWISLAMKFGKPPFSAAAASQSTWYRLPWAGAPVEADDARSRRS